MGDIGLNRWMASWPVHPGTDTLYPFIHGALTKDDDDTMMPLHQLKDRASSNEQRQVSSH